MEGIGGEVYANRSKKNGEGGKEMKVKREGGKLAEIKRLKASFGGGKREGKPHQNAAD
jgi:hypothetical protein